MYIRIADILKALWNLVMEEFQKNQNAKLLKRRLGNNKVFPLINNHGLFCDFKTILFIDPVGLQ
jgi:hypothetical protein